MAFTKERISNFCILSMVQIGLTVLACAANTFQKCQWCNWQETVDDGINKYRLVTNVYFERTVSTESHAMRTASSNRCRRKK